jgi:hypothetical protein
MPTFLQNIKSLTGLVTKPLKKVADVTGLSSSWEKAKVTQQQQKQDVMAGYDPKKFGQGSFFSTPTEYKITPTETKQIASATPVSDLPQSIAEPDPTKRTPLSALTPKQQGGGVGVAQATSAPTQDENNQFQEIIKQLIDKNADVQSGDLAEIRKQMTTAEEAMTSAKKEMEDTKALVKAGITPKTPEEIYKELEDIRNLVGIQPIEDKYNELFKIVTELPTQVKKEFSVRQTGITYPQHLIDQETKQRMEVYKAQFDVVADQLSKKEAMVKTIQNNLNLSRADAEKKLDDYFTITKTTFDQAQDQFTSAFSTYKELLKQSQEQVKANIEMGLKYPQAGILPSDNQYVSYVKALPFAQALDALAYEKKMAELSLKEISTAKAELSLQKLQLEIADTTGVADRDIISSSVNQIVFEGKPVASVTGQFTDKKLQDNIYKSAIIAAKNLIADEPQEIFNQAYNRALTLGQDADPEIIANNVLNNQFYKSILSTDELQSLYNAGNSWEQKQNEIYKQQHPSFFSSLWSWLSGGNKDTTITPTTANYKKDNITIINQR